MSPINHNIRVGDAGCVTAPRRDEMDAYDQLGPETRSVFQQTVINYSALAFAYGARQRNINVLNPTPAIDYVGAKILREQDENLVLRTSNQVGWRDDYPDQRGFKPIRSRHDRAGDDRPDRSGHSHGRYARTSLSVPLLKGEP